MKNTDLTGLAPGVAKKIAPMIEDIAAAHGQNLHSFHIVGSAILPDYNEKISDVNSVVVLRSMDLRFIEFLAPLGRKYGKKGIAAPLVMTPDYIRDSLDAFPIEFLDFKLIHKTVYGDDAFSALDIGKTHLRLQCEREIKTKQIGLRQGYISSLGKRKDLSAVLTRSFTGTMALFRAVILLMDKQPPVARAEVINQFGSCCGIGTDIFRELLALKSGNSKPSEQELRRMFERYSETLDAVRKIIDELPS
ncbi:MAG: hypothetical protein A2010_09945 [Nitrospirae bacterium GWD2_57_9]|nr:MAG: hypothetical protein A2010_09945 [Nitrospirae bacterium GWD2_57_9]